MRKSRWMSLDEMSIGAKPRMMFFAYPEGREGQPRSFFSATNRERRDEWLAMIQPSALSSQKALS